MLACAVAVEGFPSIVAVAVLFASFVTGASPGFSHPRLGRSGRVAAAVTVAGVEMVVVTSADVCDTVDDNGTCAIDLFPCRLGAATEVWIALC
mmetsp:Transcript_923/g.1153  ORF Transcript_923/g.1153 Transcript_923/m.1153 type:complete len:93 (+) Transcript_923:1733-2011(+)